jgi:peptidoglycan/LPS O-acetylase OafA/YrhL
MLAPVPAERLDFIQALRGVAASAVVLYHARVFIDGPRYLDLGTRLFGSGGAGVDLFFVISGLIMVHTSRTVAGGPRDAASFLARRFARVWPVYAVAFLAMFLLTHSLAGAAFTSTPETAGKTLAFYPLEPKGTAPFYGYPRLHVGWTLVYEMFFYLLFAAALLTGRWRRVTLVGLFALCLIVWPLATTGGVHYDAMRGYRRLGGYAAIATNPMIWDFAFGAIIGWIRATRFTPRDRGLLGCLVALTIGVVSWQLISGYRGGHGPTRWGIPMAAMVLALTLYDKAYPIEVPRWLRWLGDISFSLYLFHVLPQMVPRLVKDQPTLMTGGGFFVACIVAGVVLSYLSYRWLERGLAEWLRRAILRWLEPGRARSTVPGVSPAAADPSSGS